MGKGTLSKKYDRKIRENGILVLDVDSTPFIANPHELPYVVVAVCHSGSSDLEYDFVSYKFSSHDIAIEYPNHSVYVHNNSKDYRATLVIIDMPLFNELVNLNLDRSRFLFEKLPQFRLTSKQYSDMVAYIDAMRRIIDTNLNDKKSIIIGMVYLLSKLIDSYHSANVGDEGVKVGRLSYSFFKSLEENVDKHRDVQFYADELYLTPKYFSQSIKHETGYPAGYWIQRLLILRVKQFMCYSPHLSIQAIADQFNFPDQATFCHYFKRVTGMSPSTYKSTI